MQPLIIETLYNQHGLETFNQMVQRYGSDRVSAERVETPSKIIYRITVYIPTKENH